MIKPVEQGTAAHLMILLNAEVVGRQREREREKESESEIEIYQKNTCIFNILLYLNENNPYSTVNTVCKTIE
ncbi:hypothetical protein T01_4921 [Trichinella spiralis]|uniref:Uncharacterized protein n=1 Tax=Trichinella spiralis TaxID=6334 RepID=A0A0V1AYH2_TRISP|nr:hypothetical protein T01_4921 [Trichinella spiralis]